MSLRSRLLLVFGVLLFGSLAALPNIFPSDPAIHVSRTDGVDITGPEMTQIRSTLEEASIGFEEIGMDEGGALIRFSDVDSRDIASEELRTVMTNHVVAISSEPRVPGWMRAIGLEPMSLGLDLSGGVHFLYQVDLEAAVESFLGVYQADLRNDFRDANIRGSAPEIQGSSVMRG